MKPRGVVAFGRCAIDDTPSSRDGIIGPLLHALVGILDGGELYGRSILELQIGRLAETVRMTEGGEEYLLTPHLRLWGDIALPVGPEGAEADTLADRWRDALGDSCLTARFADSRTWETTRRQLSEATLTVSCASLRHAPISRTEWTPFREPSSPCGRIGR
jgi:hypothetical protein